MRKMLEIYSALIVLGLSVSSSFAGGNFAITPEEELKDYGNFITFYYLNPESDKAPEVLKKFLDSEFFLSSDPNYEHSKNLAAYFFARIATSDPYLVQSYISLFEKSTHEQRLFMLGILQQCGNKKVKTFLKSKLKDKNFNEEKNQIEQMLKEGIPKKYDPLSQPVRGPDDLDFLWAEFMVAGNAEAVKRIISTLSWIDHGRALAEYGAKEESGSGLWMLIVGNSAKWSLGSNCKQHKQVLQICEEELQTSKWPIKKHLREIVADAGGPVLPKDLTGKKMLKIVARDTTPGIDPNCFAALPKTTYIFGNKYARTEEQPDPPLKLHGLIVINAPDSWLINLWDKTGKHIEIPDKCTLYHSTIPPFAKEKPYQKLLDFQYGKELDFMRANNAQESTTTINGKQYDSSFILVEGIKIELITEKANHTPSMVRVFDSNKMVYSIAYDEYRADIEPNLALFEPPEDIKMYEISEKTKSAKSDKK